ncbi:MAG: hypothetical protein RLY49_233 [Candidatus Parcubacteria bacterium]|jgi:hypothetical protein
MNLDIDKKIIGRLEYVDIPDFHLSNIEAKIDTGAYNGAIHVSMVTEFEREGKAYIRFILLDEEHPEYHGKAFETDEFEERRVRSSNGDIQHRYAIPVTIHLKGLELKTKLSLSNRKDLRYPILLGRKIIKKHFIVDASKTFTHNN